MDIINIPQLSNNEVINIPIRNLELFDINKDKIKDARYNQLRSYRGAIKIEFLKRTTGCKIFNYFFHYNGTPKFQHDYWLYEKLLLVNDSNIYVVKRQGDSVYSTQILTEKDKETIISNNYKNNLKILASKKIKDLDNDSYQKQKRICIEERKNDTLKSLFKYAKDNFDDAFLGKRLHIGICSKLISYLSQKNYNKDIVNHISSFFQKNSNVKDEKELINARIENYSSQDQSEFINHINKETQQQYDNFLNRFSGKF